MPQLDQEVDAIIAEEKIDNSTLANEEPKGDDDASVPADPTPTTDPVDDPASPDEPKDDTPSEDGGKDDTEPKTEEPKPKEPETVPATPEPAPNVDEKSPTETVSEAQTLIQNLKLTDDKIFNQDGSVKPWAEVVPAGAYLAAQLQPVKVVDKEGKEHEFLLISDVEKAFPDGFEAKNNLEQLKFEKNIMANESKFDQAVDTYKQAEAQYTKETNAMVQQASDNERINKEYRAMADQGLVPKVEGDPNDPKFLEQAAVKELDKILGWMDAKNKENQAKGLGQIQSLYVAKQLMDIEGVKVTKDDKAKEIDKERKEVASLSASGTPGEDKPKQQSAPNVPMSTFAEQLIQAEGLR